MFMVINNIDDNYQIKSSVRIKSSIKIDLDHGHINIALSKHQPLNKRSPLKGPATRGRG